MDKKFAFLFICCLLAACQSPFKFQGQYPTPIPMSSQDLQYNAYTPTPFQPSIVNGDSNSVTELTHIAQLSSGSEPASFILPTPTATTIPQRRFNILLLGSDWRPSSGFRTDVILLVSINQDTGNVSLISFPRDLYVYIPGYGEDRINTAQARGGFDTTTQVFQQNFNIRIDRYIMTNFAGFTNLLDTLGGVEVNAAKDLYDRCDLPQSNDGYCYISTGSHWMDGQTALWYVRSRYSSSDFDRTRRAQEVVLALFSKLISIDALVKAPEIYSILSGNLETDLTLEEILALIPYATNVLNNESEISRFSISSTEVTSYTVPSTGAMVLLPNYDKIQMIVTDAFSR